MSKDGQDQSEGKTASGVLLLHIHFIISASTDYTLLAGQGHAERHCLSHVVTMYQY